MAIKAVFFDIGNVLLRFSNKRILRKFAWAVGRHPVKVARHIWKGRLVDRIERGELSGEEIHGQREHGEQRERLHNPRISSRFFKFLAPR